MGRSLNVRWLIPFLLVAVLPGIAPGIPLSTVTAQTAAGSSRIAFVARSADERTMTLGMVDPDGGNMVTLLTDGYFNYPAWSPDGRQLAFIGYVEPYDDPTLWLMNSDGTNLHRVLPEGRTVPDPACAVWSPDGSRFLFGVLNDFVPIDFYTVNADGSGMERLRFRGIPGQMEGVPGDIVNACAAWSPDGNQIAVLAREDGFPPGQLYLSSADGLSAAPFPATTAEGTTFHHLEWSPDGQRVLVYESPGMTRDMSSRPLAVADAEGSMIEAWIAAPPNLPGSAVWSPTGDQIAFVANEQGVESAPGGDLWVANADGSNVYTLHIEANVANLGTSWGLIPADVVLPTTSISLAEVAG